MPGNFNPDFNQASDLPNADLPRDTQADIERIAEIEEDDEE